MTEVVHQVINGFKCLKRLPRPFTVFSVGDIFTWALGGSQQICKDFGRIMEKWVFGVMGPFLRHSLDMKMKT